MSHSKERKERNCLNCGTDVQGRFCHICGQENIEPKETFWNLITHLIYDITHFDGKFFNTVKYLLLKPGFLSKEYNRGRRVSYLNPIKMYVFISAFFFLFLISVINPIINRAEELNAIMRADTTQKDKDVKIDSTHKQQNPVSNDIVWNTSRKSNNGVNIHYNYGQNYKSIKEYDSLQKLLPKDKQDGWLKRKRTYKSIRFKTEYGNDIGRLVHDLGEKFLHYFPQMFFVSLPLFALLLMLLYKKRKDIFFVNHAIFSVHLYCALFILMFLLIGLSKMDTIAYLGWLTYVEWILDLYVIWYLYKSLKCFYEQKAFKTIVKMILLMFMQTFVMLMLFVLFLAISFYSI